MPVTAYPTGSRLQKIVFDWTSTTGGAIDLSSTESFNGYLVGFETVPGSVTPTDGYSLELRDDQGYDLLGGVGATRSSTLKQMVLPKDTGLNIGPIPLCGTVLRLIGTAAGSAKTGKAIAFIHHK